MNKEQRPLQNTKPAIAVEPVLATVHYIDDDVFYDDYDEDSDYDDDDYFEREQEELQERAMNCTCGAWKMSKSGEVYHVADCCCGAE